MNNSFIQNAGNKFSFFGVFKPPDNLNEFPCLLKAKKHKNYKVYDITEIFENSRYNNSNNLVNCLRAGSKCIDIRFYWLSQKETEITVSHGFTYKDLIDHYNKQCNTFFTTFDSILVFFTLSNRFLWDENKIDMLMNEVENDIKSIHTTNLQCENCKHNFFKNLLRTCDKLYAETNLPVFTGD